VPNIFGKENLKILCRKCQNLNLISPKRFNLKSTEIVSTGRKHADHECLPNLPSLLQSNSMARVSPLSSSVMTDPASLLTTKASSYSTKIENILY